jgi:hypothetical protein
MRITERYEAVVKQTLRRITVGEDDVDHEVFIRFVTAKMDSGAIGEKPLLVVALTMPSLTPGKRFGAVSEFSSLYPSPDELDERVQGMLRDLRNLRLNAVHQIERTAVGGN